MMPEPVDPVPRKTHFGFKANPMDKLFISHGGLSSLCFDRNAFFDEMFDVDGFLSSHTQRGMPLEVLKDDLATYRKIVQSALVQLVDREYADFVHLSSSLVGVDKGIEKLKTPVEHHLKRVEDCLSVVTGHIHTLDAKLLRKTNIDTQKQQLQSLISAMECMETLVNVDRKLQETISIPARLPLLYRLSDLLVRIYAEEETIVHTTWYASIKQRLIHADAYFTQILGEELLLAVSSGETPAMQNYTIVYQHLNRIPVAYQVVADGAVKPALSTIIRSNQLRKGSLEDLLADVFAVLEERFYSLAYVGQADFIMESVWTSLVDLLIAEIQVYLAPDQADLFRKNYAAAKFFMHKFSNLFAGVRKDFAVRFWKHPATCSFLDKWSFPVYYQMRFLEIASPVEEAMGKEIQRTSRGGTAAEFKVTVSQITWNAILRCWQPDICLPELVHRFWKLSLLLISRYRSWLEGGKLQPGFVAYLSDVLADIALFRNSIVKLPSDHVRAVLEEDQRESDAIVQILSESVKESVNGLRDLEDRCVVQLATHTALEIGAIIKSVQETPRLYRRTNREAPSSAAPYVDTSFNLLVRKLKLEAALSLEQLKIGYATALKEILSQFAALVLDLLDSARRMEDSLKKLRKTRFAVDSSAGLTDDDKIRLQLFMDMLKVVHWIEELGFNVNDFPDFALAKERVMSEKPDQGN